MGYGMNDLPSDWLIQLKRVYPNRSGPMSWPRVFLKVRRALFESNWETLIEGVKRYARYCQEAGIEGSAFVVAPARFFEDEIYLEDLSFCAAEDPKKVESRNREAERFARAREAGVRVGLEPMQGECAAAFETRVSLAQTHGGNRANHSVGDHAAANALGSRLAGLTDKLRIAK